MIDNQPLTLGSLLRQYGSKFVITWGMLALEVALLALIPLFLGFTIDALLKEPSATALIDIFMLLTALIAVSVTRRAYDTRAYGTMRIHLSTALVKRSQHKPVSMLSAQVGMGRELVDFLEEQTPQLINSVIQVVVSMVILFGYGLSLGVAGVMAVSAMIAVYALFHLRFFRLNAGLNAIAEEQVTVLQSGDTTAISKLFTRRRESEVKISDTDSLMYGLIYLIMFSLILANLWSASLIPAVSVGAIFAIISYSWELVDASVELPATLQQWARLTEIQERINR